MTRLLHTRLFTVHHNDNYRIYTIHISCMRYMSYSGSGYVRCVVDRQKQVKVRDYTQVFK